MAHHEKRPWALLRRGVLSFQVDEKREPLKSKNNEGRSSEKGSGKEAQRLGKGGSGTKWIRVGLEAEPCLLGSTGPTGQAGSREEDARAFQCCSVMEQQKEGLECYEKEAEKQGVVCPQVLAETPLPRERVVPASLSLAEELSQAMLRMDMALEREYAFDIFSSLMQKQPSYAFQGFDLPRSVTVEMRALLVDWLVQVHEYLSLADETLYLAVYLMNAYMKAGRVRIPHLQLLSITCLFLACKLEEHTCPEPAQLCFLMEDSCSRKDLLRMERKILAQLRFELHYANPIHLFHLLAEAAHCTLEVQFLALYFMEVSLMEVDCLRFEPAQLCFAALSLAQLLLCEAKIKDMDVLQECFPKFHVYREAELSAVFPYMAKAVLQGANSTLRAIFLKYSRPQKLCASTNPAIAASKFLSHCLGNPTL